MTKIIIEPTNAHAWKMTADLMSNRTKNRGWPGGAVVKCARSASAAWGLLVQMLGEDVAPLGTPCCGRHPT